MEKRNKAAATAPFLYLSRENCRAAHKGRFDLLLMVKALALSVFLTPTHTHTHLQTYLVWAPSASILPQVGIYTFYDYSGVGSWHFSLCKSRCMWINKRCAILQQSIWKIGKLFVFLLLATGKSLIRSFVSEFTLNFIVFWV